MAQQQDQKTVEQKLKECRELNIQNLEKVVISKQMVWKFIQDKQWDQKVKSIILNNKIGVCRLDFVDHESAKQFYEKFNFQAKIIHRTFNIYFHLTLNENEMKKYYIEGITEQAQRPLFQATKKIGVCKIYTNYGPGSQGKIKPTGIISFLRKQDLSEQQQNYLRESLGKLGIKVNKYVSDSNLKCSIRILNFYKGSLSQEDDVISIKAKEQIENDFRKVVKEGFSSINITVKRKENQQKQEIKEVKALLQFSDFESTIENFQLLREHMLDDGQTKAILYFHNDQNNSYLSLFTSGLCKPEEIKSDKAFENVLLDAFRQINKNVVQVLVFPVKRNNTYVARVYLKSVQDGKDFIVQYTNKREVYAKFYKDKNYISFNINIDGKLMAKIKMHERKVNQIVGKIKNADEQQKRATTRPPKQPQLTQLPNNPALFQGMGMNPRMNPMVGMNPLSGMSSISGMPQMGSMGPIPMGLNMSMGGGVGSMGVGAPPPITLKASIQRLKQSKEAIMKNPNGKGHLFPVFKRYLIENLHLSELDSGKEANQLMNSNSLENLFNLLQNPDEIKKIISSKN